MEENKKTPLNYSQFTIYDSLINYARNLGRKCAGAAARALEPAAGDDGSKREYSFHATHLGADGDRKSVV